MNARKNTIITILLVISISSIAAMSAILLLTHYYSSLQFQMLGGFSQTLIAENVLDSDTLMAVLKKNNTDMPFAAEKNILEGFGYRAADFNGANWSFLYLTAALCLGAGIFLFLFTFLYWHHKECRHYRLLTEYLEKVNTGGQGLLFSIEESDHSRLQDEIYKTVTTLYQTRDAAISAKHNFADNLYNIAHQLKTPITAISLSAQMIEENFSTEYAGQIRKQTARLVHLEEALLLLSRIDAGTLALEKTKLDVFTVLTLAADNLQELSAFFNITIDIPELEAATFTADMEWTMEAIMNLMKNCMEHSPAGSAVHCSYGQNPLYVQIRIWDEGTGFEKEDLPHLFERFYRGKNAAKEGIGIGLSLSKSIIEMQNGIISAGNLPDGGAFFEIRMYRH